jgi:hypothetical protein
VNLKISVCYPRTALLLRHSNMLSS